MIELVATKRKKNNVDDSLTRSSAHQHPIKCLIFSCHATWGKNSDVPLQVLVGESLVKRSDPGKGISELFGKNVSL